MHSNRIIGAAVVPNVRMTPRVSANFDEIPPGAAGAIYDYVPGTDEAAVRIARVIAVFVVHYLRSTEYLPDLGLCGRQTPLLSGVLQRGKHDTCQNPDDPYHDQKLYERKAPFHLST